MKSKFWSLLAVLGLAAVVQGCSLKPQYLHIDPPVKVSESQVGAGRTVGLAVSDARTEKKLGEVGDPLKKLVDVTVDEDFSPAVYKRLAGALTKMGFNVVPYSEEMERSLQIKVRNMALQSLKTPFTFETELRAVVAAHAQNGLDYYDRQFNVRTRKDGAAPPFEKDSNALVNTAMSQALEDLLADEQLIQLLAR